MKRLFLTVLTVGFLSVNAQAEQPGLRILSIGDSHSVGEFGIALDRQLRDHDSTRELSSYASCSSKVSSWYSGFRTHCGWRRTVTTRNQAARTAHGLLGRTPRFTNLLRRKSPDVTLVALGANSLKASDPANRDSMVRIITDIQASGSECIWIGPPREPGRNEQALTNYYRLLHETIGNDCRIFDSRPFTQFPRDGNRNIHLDAHGEAGRAIAREWAAAAADFVRGV